MSSLNQASEDFIVAWVAKHAYSSKNYSFHWKII